MQNLTTFSDNELSLIFDNDESLYNEKQKAIRHEDFRSLRSLCAELFIYTPS